jgi:hypothetical protein
LGLARRRWHNSAARQTGPIELWGGRWLKLEGVMSEEPRGQTGWWKREEEDAQKSGHVQLRCHLLELTTDKVTNESGTDLLVE